MILVRALVASLPVFVGCGQQTPSWPAIQKQIADDFPAVEEISIDAFMKLGRDSVLLVDVRAPEEYEVSHLEGAVNLVDAPAVLERARVAGSPPVVVYCSVGYRSARIADEMRRLGYADVKNLEGSIFAWANRGMPVQNAGGVTGAVHPYDDSWGGLLDSKYHPQPESD